MLGLHAMAGIVDHRHIGALRGNAKIAHAPSQLAKIRIKQLDDLDVQPAQRLADRTGIIDGILQWRHRLIGTDADHQCDLP